MITKTTTNSRVLFFTAAMMLFPAAQYATSDIQPEVAFVRRALAKRYDLDKIPSQLLNQEIYKETNRSDFKLSDPIILGLTTCWKGSKGVERKRYVWFVQIYDLDCLKYESYKHAAQKIFNKAIENLRTLDFILSRPYQAPIRGSDPVEIVLNQNAYLERNKLFLDWLLASRESLEKATSTFNGDQVYLSGREYDYDEILFFDVEGNLLWTLESDAKKTRDKKAAECCCTIS